MKLTFPAGSVKILCSSEGLTLYRRQLNQAALYFISYFGTVIHVGKRKHCVNMFNRYRPNAIVGRFATAAS
jgi:hypothetical protein